VGAGLRTEAIRIRDGIDWGCLNIDLGLNRFILLSGSPRTGQKENSRCEQA
jgi:hypothetical protein